MCIVNHDLRILFCPHHHIVEAQAVSIYRLGHYDVTALIGEGGMGQIY